jgi:phospholipid/cholesterol/gamma-HCH transport system substrate-binding protein
MKGIDNKIKYKKLARFIELSIWFLLLVFVLGIGYIAKQNYNQHKTYQIFLQDVDGIIKGSPVRMMGIHIGYVRKVKIINDMVFVDFIINQDGIEIPKGSKVTVEFTGLGGSKSIEIYTPKDKVPKGSQTFEVQQPRRLGAALSLLDSMLEKISAIMFQCTSFTDSINRAFSQAETPKSNKPMSEVLNDTDSWLDETQKKIDKNKNNNIRKRGMNK